MHMLDLIDKKKKGKKIRRGQKKRKRKYNCCCIGAILIYAFNEIKGLFYYD